MFVVQNISFLNHTHTHTHTHRCPPLFDVLLRMVAMATSYSSFWLRDHAHTQHCVATAEGKLPPAEMSSLKAQREEQCSALIAAQDSAIVQLLLEICLPTDEDKEVGWGLRG